MNDIIKDAKQLLDGVTSGKWRSADSDIIVEASNRFIATVSEYSGLDEPSEEYSNVQLIAAAPELAQALAEETWEYSFQILRRDEWEHASDRVPGVDEWFPSKYVADFIMDAAQKSGYVCRPVRRRVSPPEVISE